jgi:hypothetical protein
LQSKNNPLFVEALKSDLVPATEVRAIFTDLLAPQDMKAFRDILKKMEKQQNRQADKKSKSNK